MSNSQDFQEELNILTKHFSQKQLEKISKPVSQNAISRYYARNNKYYRRFLSKEGYMHVALDGDYTKHMQIVDTYLPKSAQSPIKVLEIGAGNGSNSAWLAEKNPKIDFLATDIMNKGLKHPQPNQKQILADFHTLDGVADNSCDAAFAIETICHSEQKHLVLQALAKKLKPGAPLIIFDCYTKDRSEMSANEKLAKHLWGISMAVNDFESLNEWEDVVANSPFNIKESINLKTSMQAFADKLTHRAKKFFTSTDFRIRLARITLPTAVQQNAISGLLSSAAFREDLYYYYLHVLVKNDIPTP